MIKNNQQFLNHFHVVLDALIVAGAYALAWYLLIASRIFPAGHGVLPPQVYFRALIPVVPGYLFMYWLFHLYEPKRTRTKRKEFLNIVEANVLGMMVFTTILFAFRRSGYFANFSTKMIAAFCVINVIATTVERFGIRFILTRLRRKGFNQKHIILVGFSDVSDQFVDACHRNPDWGYHIYGIVDDITETGVSYRGVKIIGKIKDLEEILAGNTDTIIMRIEYR